MADDRNDRIEALEARVGELAQAVATLQAQLQGARDRASLTMREQTRCPGCGGTKILHSNRVVDSGNPGNQLGLFTKTKAFGRFRADGPLEAYVCMTCFLVEWYVSNLDNVDLELEQFRVLEGVPPDEAGPYR